MKWTIIRMAGLVVVLAGVAVLLPGRGAEAWSVPPPSPCLDFATGGGWFTPTPLGNDKANFGFNAGYKNGTKVPLKGELNYIDHNNGMHVHSTSVDTYTAYDCFDAVHGKDCDDRVFTGSATVNGASGYTYRVEVIDEGEPGNVPKGHDRFTITVSGQGLSYFADSGGAPNEFTSP